MPALRCQDSSPCLRGTVSNDQRLGKLWMKYDPCRALSCSMPQSSSSAHRTHAADYARRWLMVSSFREDAISQNAYDPHRATRLVVQKAFQWRIAFFRPSKLFDKIISPVTASYRILGRCARLTFAMPRSRDWFFKSPQASFRSDHRSRSCSHGDVHNV